MERLVKMSCEDFVAELGSKSPTPSAGCATALIAALGVALGNMTASLTIGKARYADVEDDMIRLKAKSDEIQKKLLDFVARDATAFEPLSKAYAMPSRTEEEEHYKEEVLERCFHECCVIPLEMMEACCDAIDIIEEIEEKGSRLLLSDAACGTLFLKSALKAGYLNILANTHYMKERKYAEGKINKAYIMLTKYTAKADMIFAKVEEDLLHTEEFPY